jgi:hypothetical protein
MPALAEVNGITPQFAASTVDELANILLVAMMGDGNFSASWRTPANGWVQNQLLSFSTESGTSVSSSPDVELAIIAMNQNHRLYETAADGTAIVEYEWSSSNPYSFIWASKINVTQALNG